MKQHIHNQTIRTRVTDRDVDIKVNEQKVTPLKKEESFIKSRARSFFRRYCDDVKSVVEELVNF